MLAELELILYQRKDEVVLDHTSGRVAILEGLFEDDRDYYWVLKYSDGETIHLTCVTDPIFIKEKITADQYRCLEWCFPERRKF